MHKNEVNARKGVDRFGYGPGITTNPQRDAFINAIGDILGNGHKLTVKDINEIGTHYGYAESNSDLRVGHIRAREALAKRGVMLSVTFENDQQIFFDGSIMPENETLDSK